MKDFMIEVRLDGGEHLTFSWQAERAEDINIQEYGLINFTSSNNRIIFPASKMVSIVISEVQKAQ